LGVAGALATIWQLFAAKGGEGQQASPAEESPSPEPDPAAGPAQPASVTGPSVGFDRVYRCTHDVQGQPEVKPGWGIGGMEVKVSTPVRTQTVHVRLTADGRFSLWADQGPVTHQGAYAVAGDEVRFTTSDGTTFTGRLGADRMTLTIGNLVYAALTPEREVVSGCRLQGTYHRYGLLDEQCKEIDNHIAFTADGRFEEQGFLYAALGARRSTRTAGRAPARGLTASPARPSS
jgi:hypothetical protein